MILAGWSSTVSPSERTLLVAWGLRCRQRPRLPLDCRTRQNGRRAQSGSTRVASTSRMRLKRYLRFFGCFSFRLCLVWD